jgi:hypothetical protein
MKRLLLSVGLMALASAAHADLFTGGSTFNVITNGTPGGGGTDSAQFTIATGLTNAGLDLSSTEIPGTDRPGAEWLIFQYTSDGSISPSQGFWQVDESGLQLNHPAFLIRGFVQFDINGVIQGFNVSPFPGQSPVGGPPGGLSALLSGPGVASPVNPDTNPADAFMPGPLPSLGTFFNPFSQLNGQLTNPDVADQINSYTEALEFAPAAVGGVPELSTWTYGLVGFGLLGLTGFIRKRTSARFA